MKNLRIAIKDQQKRILITPRITLRLKKAILKACKQEKTQPSGEITLCLVDDKKIRELNRKFFRRRSSTDVIAFDISEEGGSFLADIAVSADEALRNSKLYRTSPLYELYLYAVHGMLHILGYDDKTEKQRLIMERKSLRVLSSLHITPYTLHKNQCPSIRQKPLS